ncbi:MAG: IS3 family transposase [Syntrophales bacterium]
MARNMRRSHDATFKARVALEAIRGEKTIAQVAAEYGVHPNQIRQWRQKLLDELPQLFSDRRKSAEKDGEELQDELYRQIGQLKVELDWLKKKFSTASVEEKRRLIEPEHQMISVSQQRDLLDLARSSYYYHAEKDESYNHFLMNLIDAQFTRTPFYGVPKMTFWLRRQGQPVNPKRVRRLMRLMGLEAIYPKRRLSKACPYHKKYPYLLRNLEIDHSDQVWCADITYIRMYHGFIYLVAVMDWFSRYVMAWELSITLDTAFCVQALERALQGSKPEIFNMDQGVQFTATDFISSLEKNNIQISMDGHGRVYDNIFVERLWRTVKYEEVYLHDYRSVSEARVRLASYFQFYNMERIHEALAYRTPYEVYSGKPFHFNHMQAYSSMHLKQAHFLS